MYFYIQTYLAALVEVVDTNSRTCCKTYRDIYICKRYINMCRCIYVLVYVYLHVYVLVHAYLFIRTCTCVLLYVLVHAYLFVYLYVLVHAYLSTYLYLYMSFYVRKSLAGGVELDAANSRMSCKIHNCKILKDMHIWKR